jgi:hypothetical protein
MKSFLLLVILVLVTSANTFSQDCPGALNVVQVLPVNPPCGSVGNFTFIVYLDKPNQNVSYQHGPDAADCFDLPTGWTFAQTAYKGLEKIGPIYYEKYEITVQPGQYNAGTGRIRNKAFCGTSTPLYSQWYSFNISRPASAAARNLTGSDNICVGGSSTFSLNAVPGDGNFTWSTGGSLFINGSQGSSSIQAGGNSNGSSNIQVSFSDACSNSITRNKFVFAGTPTLQQMTYGTAGTGVNNTVYTVNSVSANTWYIVRANEPRLVWNPNNSSVNGYVSGPYEYRFYLNPGQTLMFYPLTATNSCGTNTRNPTFTTSSSYRVLLNPSTTNLLVEFDNTDYLEALPEQVDLLSEKSTNPVLSVKIKDIFDRKAFKNGNGLEFDTKNLPRGTYLFACERF